MRHRDAMGLPRAPIWCAGRLLVRPVAGSVAPAGRGVSR
jgi:hypothetical protein